MSKSLSTIPDKQSWFNQTFGKPWVGFTGTVVTIIALGLAIFFYLSERKERDLVYTINPQRTQIVKADEYSQLQVYFDSILVKTNLTAVHIIVWNNGELAIDSTDVLSPLTIRTADKFKIYFATITDTSRYVTNISLDTSQKEKGILKLDWRILEKNDGFVIQILYAGDEKKDFTVESVIKGQGKIKRIDQEDAFELGKGKFIYLILALAIGTLVLLFSFFSKMSFRNLIFISSIGLILQIILIILYFTDKPSLIIPFLR